MLSEKRLWWEMDKIAVRESGPNPAMANMPKANAAENMMRYLEKPTKEEQKDFWQHELSD